MKLSAKFVRSQLALFKSVITETSIEASRKGQNTLGRLLARIGKKGTEALDYELDGMPVSLISPKDELSSGIILYLHGGGYTCGDIAYAKGFSTVLASRCGIKVFAVAYSLAPEKPFPAAIDDCLRAYEHLLLSGYSPKEIMLCGESAGGGLCYSLCLKLKELNREMPAGIITVSPWTDLTSSGESYTKNKK